MYGFGEACQNVSESELKEKADNGNRKAGKILKIVDKPRNFVVTIQFMATAFAMVVGFYQVKTYGGMFALRLCKGFEGYERELISIVAYLLSALVIMTILLTVGIIVPQKLGKRHPEAF